MATKGGRRRAAAYLGDIGMVRSIGHGWHDKEGGQEEEAKNQEHLLQSSHCSKKKEARGRTEKELR